MTRHEWRVTLVITLLKRQCDGDERGQHLQTIKKDLKVNLITAVNDKIWRAGEPREERDAGCVAIKF